jgi:hypothetical protein
MDLSDRLYRITHEDNEIINNEAIEIRITYDNYRSDNITTIRFRLENGVEYKINFYQEDGDEIDNLYKCTDCDSSLIPCNKPRYLTIMDGYFICPYNMRNYS